MAKETDASLWDDAVMTGFTPIRAVLVYRAMPILASTWTDLR